MQTCNELAELFPLLADDSLEEKEKQTLLEHLEVCETCRASYKDLSDMINDLHKVPPPEFPIGLHESLMASILQKEERKASAVLERRFSFKTWGLSAAGVAAALLILSAVVSGIANAPSITSAPNQEFVSEMAAAPEIYDYGIAAGTVSESSLPALGRIAPAGQNQFSHTFHITINVEDLRQAVAVIESLPGYTMESEINQYEFESGGNAWITRRIETGAYEHAKTVLHGLGKVTGEEENTKNLAGDRLDLEARLKAKTQEQDRLLALLGKSLQLDVLTKVESQLSGVGDESDDLHGQLNALLDEIKNPMLQISLTGHSPMSETIAPATFAYRLGDSFTRSAGGTIAFLEGVLLFAVGAFIPLILPALIGLVVWLIVRRLLRKGVNKR